MQDITAVPRQIATDRATRHSSQQPRPRSLHAVVALLCATIVTASCAAPAAAALATTGGLPETLAVCGVDRSRSMRMRTVAIQRCAELIQRLPWGRITVRWIASHSYDEQQSILDVVIPPPPEPCTNPFAPRCAPRHEWRLQQIRAIRDSAVAVLMHAASAPAAPATDITGFLAACGDWLSAAAAEAGGTHPLQGAIYLATDLVQTTTSDVGAHVDLHGAAVTVFQDTGGSPAAAQRRRAWFGSVAAADDGQPPRYIPLAMRDVP